MKIIKIIFILIFVVLSACGYKPINQLNKNKFTIKSFTGNGDTAINNFLNINFNRHQEQPDNKRKLDIISDSQIQTTVETRNNAGEATGYRMQISVLIKIYENEKLIETNQYSKVSSYSNLNSKFELKNYEKILMKNLVSSIISEINYDLVVIE